MTPAAPASHGPKPICRAPHLCQHPCQTPVHSTSADITPGSERCRTCACPQAARSLLHNPEVNLGPYIHILMPALLSCALARRIGEPGSEAHLAVRDSAADVLALACSRLGAAHASLQPRVTREYVKALTDEAKPLRTHYGACYEDI